MCGSRHSSENRLIAEEPVGRTPSGLACFAGCSRDHYAGTQMNELRPPDLNP